MPFSDCASAVSTSRSEQDDGFQSRRGGRAAVREDDDEHERERSSSTPRKRIISDSHWKAKRDANGHKSYKGASKSRPESAWYDLSYTSNQERNKERRTSSKSQHNIEGDQGLRQSSSVYDDDDVTETAFQHDGRQRSALDAPTPYDLESHVDDALARYLTSDFVRPDDFDAHSDTSMQPEDSSPVSRSRSKYAEQLAKATEDYSSGDTPRSKKVGLLGKTRSILLKSEPVGPVKNRIPSIEAWLEEQPDPFVQQSARDDLPNVEIPLPLTKRTNRKRHSAETSIVADPNKIWDSIALTQESRPRESAGFADRIRAETMAIPSPASDNDSTPKRRIQGNGNQDDNDGSPSSLRRRGARVRRQRDLSRNGSISNVESLDLGEPFTESLGTAMEAVNAARPHSTTLPLNAVSRLPTIPSMETVKDDKPEASPESTTPRENSGLQRRLTTHEDLMSVLSMPRAGRSRRRSRRSVRSVRASQQASSAQEVLAELLAEEERYKRELQTLVDGVIPVLLQCVLSKADSAATAGLFTSTNPQDDVNITKPIIDMGIALERLRTLHNRIPFHNVDSLLGWAQTSQKAYREYLQAWRLGFQDVVVNLAPLEDSSSLAQGMARDDHGDLVDMEGKKVDVAYLLKRPLVRVKGLSKTFAQIRDKSAMPLASQVADIYAGLMLLAKRRHQEEQARLEDEAAAHIDASRARDIRTMAATVDAVVNKSRRVKARDFFNLTLYHSSGQRIDCGVELIFRDNPHGEADGGDVLVCEVDDTGKWLLFAPVELSSVSARRGEDGFDLVVMIRGRAGFGPEWHELLALKCDDDQAVTEWMNMLGSNPLPPRLNRTQSFVKRSPRLAVDSAHGPAAQTRGFDEQTFDAGSSPANLDVPIGEPSVIGSKTETSRRSEHLTPLFDKPLPRLNLGGGLAPKPVSTSQVPSTLVPRQSASSALSSDRSTISDRSVKAAVATSSSTSSKYPPSTFGQLPQQQQESRAVRSLQSTHSEWPQGSQRFDARGANGSPPQKPTRTDRDSRDGTSSPVSQQAPKTGVLAVQSASQQSPLRPSIEKSASSSSPAEAAPSRPELNRTISSAPSKALPTVNKTRSHLSQPSPSTSENAKTPPGTPGYLLEGNRRSEPALQDHKNSPRTQMYPDNASEWPAHSPSQINPSRSESNTPSRSKATPPRQGAGILRPLPNNVPNAEPTATQSPSESPSRRRISSPLKHEYAPSTTSDSSSEYDSDSASDSSSDTSEDLRSEHKDVPTPLVAIPVGGRRTSKHPLPPPSVQSKGTRTLAPSDSASQGPYRKVPPSTTVSAQQKSKTIALICSWSEKGMWEQIHPDECSIVISPGLIEAFEMSAAHSNPMGFGARSPADSPSRTSSLAQQPLVAFELTPIVPLRRGTALDISIRSPPTANSKIRTTNNVMFRSRNAEECEALYGMINWARCNNPTYIQLQNARPPRQPSVRFSAGQNGHSRSRSSSWFSFGNPKRSSSYRASSAPIPASVDASVESSGSMTSAFSALKIFGSSSAFNLSRSSVIQKSNASATGDSLYSSSTGTGTHSGSSTPVPSQLGLVPGKDGPNVPSTSAAAADGGGMINNMKIRLYVRKGQHWENLGAARLSVLPAPVGADSGKSTPDRPPPGHGRSSSSVESVGHPGQLRAPRLASSSHTPHRIHGNGREKRILISRNKGHGVMLLDSVLGESCFERVMQTGIAVKVWAADETITKTGGVTMGKETLYMMQFPSTKEAGWVFGLCGTYRYGVGAAE